MSGFLVKQPGLLTLIQDAGRYGQHRIGLTTGGPLDGEAFKWANRLCGNELDATGLEVSIGGLVLEAQVDTALAVTGADMPFKINGQDVARWCTHKVKAGDKIELGFATSGSRAYLTVAGGFNIGQSFSSTATVTREAVGGLSGDKLKQGDLLPCQAHRPTALWALPESEQPDYNADVTLRVILGYQHRTFDSVQQRLFFSSEYVLSSRADRMGFRLEGQPVKSQLNGILSEGICHGAIQIPADGQPIVLLNDRQTIGGYPKIGSVVSRDTAQLSQRMPGAKIRFEEISLEKAHNINCLAQRRFINTSLQQIA
ncbi:biotin-dependent carboxyltransferase family protein [Neptunomonas sp.]|uniref:5-oxoprolinase subunit C family protein n=1 Tax=Neptunomonas sp. TaxID=1971898 RepID=UPI0025DAA35A|nr:biotin-dependent carboxyltransferase family protein [Neptunomonas sp.]